jgi:hypothetical protein
MEAMSLGHAECSGVAMAERRSARFTLGRLAGLSNSVIRLTCCRLITHSVISDERMRAVSFSKPKFSLRAETYALRKSTPLCLLAIPAFDCIAGLSNRHVNCTSGMCLR